MRRLCGLAAAILSLGLLGGCGPKDVGDVSLGVFTLKDIKINSFVDPKVPGVTCHISSIEANLSFSDPSNNSVSCRQSGPITAGMIAAIDKSKSGEVLFERSKSIFLKTLKIRRIYDEQSQTLLYLAYTTKETSGSYHHSLSAVPLWGTSAYVARPESPAQKP
jgi:CreA protein